MHGPTSQGTDVNQSSPTLSHVLSSAGEISRDRSGSRRPSVAVYLWVVGIALLPVYVFDSGTPQPSHVVLAVAAAVTWAEFRDYAPQFKPLVRAYGLFVLVVTVVTIVWAILAPMDVRLFPAIFALFNFMIVRTVLVLYTHERRRFLRSTAYTFAIVLVVLAVNSVLSAQASLIRATGTFNNPNQQAFFAVVAISAIVAIGSALPVDWWLKLAALTSASYLVVVANSKAGFVALAVVMVVVALTNLRLALAIVVISVAFVAMTDPGNAAYDRIETRLLSVQRDDTLDARGYGLILEHPEHLILGSGEGYRERFDFSTEIHSTIGTIAFAYGIAGIVTFGVVLFELTRVGGVLSLVVLVPSLVYGLAHNGLRFAPFWILLALAAASGDLVRSNVAMEAPLGPPVADHPPGVASPRP